MLKILIASYLFAFALFVLFIDTTECRILNIDLIRRRTPRENLMHAKHLGLDFELEKPNPKPHNSSNYTLALRRYLDNEFYGSVRLGSTGQEFHVIFDTAWTTSWIMSKDCSAKVQGCTGHQLYDHDRSATYLPDGKSYFNNEGLYNFTGYYSYDKINYGGTKISKQSFVEMTYVPPSYYLSKADGVIGLSLPFGGQKTMPVQLYEMGLLKQPVFCIYMNRDTQSNRGGNIMLGAINQKHIHVTNKVQDKVTYTQVDDTNGMWSFKMDGVAVTKAKKSIPVCLHDCKAFVDTGSINIIAKKEEVDAINKEIRAFPVEDGKYAVDCSTIMKLPPINFIIGGQNFTLKGHNYVQKVTVGNVLTCYSVFKESDTPSETGAWVLGVSFLSHFFSIYNFETKVIGFVTAA